MSLPTKIKFDESFFEEEERCNFYVTRKRKELWAILLDLWREFDRVCRKYNLTEDSAKSACRFRPTAMQF